MTLSPLPLIMIEPPVRAALLEDLGRAGDLTTDAIVPAKAWAETALVARQPGVVAGLDAAALAFRLVDPAIEIAIDRPDGTHVGPGDCIATIAGPARSVLTAERVALNFLGHLSGVATATATLVAAVRGHKARICCTRKTMPGLRSLQKYAVRAGGGVNHRFGLDDAVLIKDNHVAAAGGVAPAIRAARAGTGHLVKIEVEVDSLDQLDQALAENVGAVLLDNMAPRCWPRRCAASAAVRLPRRRAASRRPPHPPLPPAASISFRPAGSPTALPCSTSVSTGSGWVRGSAWQRERPAPGKVGQGGNQLDLMRAAVCRRIYSGSNFEVETMTKLLVLVIAVLALTSCKSDAERGVYVAPPAGGWDNFRG